MNDFRIVCIALLGACLVSGCEQATEVLKDQPKPNLAPTKTREQTIPPRNEEARGPTPEDEDPKLVKYFQQKGWQLSQPVWNFRKPENDNFGTLFLTVKRPPGEDESYVFPLEDFQQIAKSQVIQVVDFSDVRVTDDGLAQLAGMPKLQGISFNHDTETVTDAALTTLAKSPTLEVIQLGGFFFEKTSRITDKGLRELAKLPTLRVLRIGAFNGTGEGFEAFADHPTLEELYLIHAQKLTDKGAEHIAQIPRLKRLKIDNDYPFDSDPKKMPALTSRGILSIVKTRLPTDFDFDQQLINDESFKLLVEKGWLYGPNQPDSHGRPASTPKEVQGLWLEGSEITDKSIALIQDCTNIESVALSKTNISDESLRILGTFSKLNLLLLEECQVTGKGLAFVADLPIQDLNLENCDLDKGHFQVIGKMTKLEYLQLDSARFNPAWLKHISHLPKLNRVDCQFTALDDAGLQELLKLPTLERCKVYRTKVTSEMLEKAKTSHPHVAF